ncbi:hypothetical protein [Stenotrophomonas sp. YIM B13575]|uniref:hypothetical protein n=1 Tax=Stenotrophomonas sp. YIM B13575 TaxID=3366314 RepID=UPI0036A6FAE0
MTAPCYPYLLATLGDAAERLPRELAEPLEAALSAAVDLPEPITLVGCLQRIRSGDAADGQPWKGPVPSPGQGVTGQGVTRARTDRAAAGLITLLEVFHAAERVRVDGDEKDDIGDGAREGLLLACRGLASMWSCRRGCEIAQLARSAPWIERTVARPNARWLLGWAWGKVTLLEYRPTSSTHPLLHYRYRPTAAPRSISPQAPIERPAAQAVAFCTETARQERLRLPRRRPWKRHSNFEKRGKF